MDKQRDMTTAVPQHLSPAARALWQAIFERYVFDVPHQLLLLTKAMEFHDRAAQASAVLLREGPFVTDRHGQRKPHPAILVERDSTAMCARLLRQLKLDEEESLPIFSERSERARKAWAERKRSNGGAA